MRSPDERDLDAVHRDRAGPVASSPSPSRCCASSSGRSLYSTTPVRPSIRAMTPILSSGPSLRTTMVDMSASPPTWWPTNVRAADREQRVVDLEGEDRLRARGGHLVERPRGPQRRQQAAVAVGRQRQAVRAPRAGSTRPRGPPPAGCPARRTAPTAAPGRSGRARRRTRAWPRRSGARSARTRAAARRSGARRASIFAAWWAKSGRAGDRAEGEGALGPVEAEARALAAGQQHGGDAARPQGLARRPRRASRSRSRSASVRGSADDVLGPPAARSRPSPACAPSVDQAAARGGPPGRGRAPRPARAGAPRSTPLSRAEPAPPGGPGRPSARRSPTLTSPAAGPP